MAKESDQKDSSSVDKGLVAMFLRMSPDERLLANDNMVRTILELRNAYRQRKNNRIGSKRKFKKTSKDPKDKQRLLVLEETLRQVNEE